MQQHQEPTVFDLKNQARRIRDGLWHLGHALSHTDSLQAVAYAHGHRNWEALLASISAATGTHTPSPAALPAQAPMSPPQEERDEARWLRVLETALRFHGVSESDLDDWAYEGCGENAASAINNAGMSEQLAARLRCHKAGLSSLDARRGLAIDVEQVCSSPIPLPEWDGAEALPAVRMTVCTNRGTRHEMSDDFDALEWLAIHGLPGLETLLTGGLEASRVANQIPLWLEQHGQASGNNLRLKAMLDQARENASEPRSPATLTQVWVSKPAIQSYVKRCCAHRGANDMACIRELLN